MNIVHTTISIFEATEVIKDYILLERTKVLNDNRSSWTAIFSLFILKKDRLHSRSESREDIFVVLHDLRGPFVFGVNLP